MRAQIQFNPDCHLCSIPNSSSEQQEEVRQDVCIDIQVFSGSASRQSANAAVLKLQSTKTTAARVVKHLSVSGLWCFAAAWSSGQDSFRISKRFFRFVFFPFVLELGGFVLFGIWFFVCLGFVVCFFFTSSEISIFLWAVSVSGISGKNPAMSKLWATAENKRATNKRREPTRWVTWRENYMSACKKVPSNKYKFLTLLPRECWMTADAGCSKADTHLLLKEAQFHIVANSHSNFA